jgi:hypothetical protein
MLIGRQQWAGVCETDVQPGKRRRVRDRLHFIHQSSCGLLALAPNRCFGYIANRPAARDVVRRITCVEHAIQAIERLLVMTTRQRGKAARKLNDK